jgi:hypothetical protein
LSERGENEKGVQEKRAANDEPYGFSSTKALHDAQQYKYLQRALVWAEAIGLESKKQSRTEYKPVCPGSAMRRWR